MFITTHMLIAKNVISVIEKKLNIKLDPINFLYGNIKPDINSLLISIPHYKNKSLPFVLDIIDSIQFETLPTYNGVLKTFSVNLGVVNHYLADFFCYAHNNSNLDKFVPHFIYENNLSIEFYKKDLKRICNCSVDFVSNNSSVSIKNYIESKYQDYINIAPSMDTDILFSAEVCTAVSYIIVKNCLNNVLFNIA